MADHPSIGDPRLAELRRRYAAYDGPLAARSQWSDEFVGRELSFGTFRGDNCFVWQRRYFGEDERSKYLRYTGYVAGLDRLGLLDRLGEDGAFGCETHSFAGRPTVSRDLLDSVNEIYFLDRHLGLLGRRGVRILDIGAGYGRLAHRMTQAVPGLASYTCVDGVAEATYLCEYYLGFRQAGEVARTVPLDEVRERIGPGDVDVAVNIHSFSEMPYAAAAGWIAFLAEIRTPLILVVPNYGAHLTACEEIVDGVETRTLPLLPAFEEHEYRLVVREPTLRDPEVGELIGTGNHFLLFARAAS
ncbi:putative sugar O-methyltransferase [Spongiactinospora sp. TRM90649]|uniref:putative sugar O-methyltransferase n=1 Tax=Spongiactinospora sp. TRM90649 TaxID=3031114 RepID=UPI0023F951FD|nr:putative sugar O-methyltransferase [Spongiactinospora sp. TRM90649]MDF5757586.1 putative sugar O-methyltransferase [Spongiactinospora sp. TRM90649]